jgi:hypothetical protein
MKALPLFTALFAAVTVTVSAPLLAQAPAEKSDQPAASQAQAPKKEASKAYHAGGPRHDQRAHEATLQARQQGQKLEEPKVHPGGRHDQSSHEAALRAQQAQDAAAKK